MSSHTRIDYIQHYGASDDYEKRYLYADGGHVASKGVLLFLYLFHVHYY